MLLVSAIPEINQLDVTLISDHDKCLMAANSIYDRSQRTHCCQHISDNIQRQFGMAARSLFWTVARARTEADYSRALAVMQQDKQRAAQYLAEIARRQYATAFFPARRFSHLT